ncbi:50S ribosomal protein L6 [archaeon]|nr:50S ribosomal protein L6 [archaeon]MBL7056718.1 50S ribosomal protein L6 [Candidatus Woesearchaeota archaeon]
MREEFKVTINTPEGCQVSMDADNLVIKGDKGELKRKFSNPLIKLELQDNNVTLNTKTSNKRTKKLQNTFIAHINNMFKGVVEGHIYKLKICSGHFPMTVSVKNNMFEIKNFIGEKVPRELKITEGTSVKIDGTEIVVEGIGKEKVGQMAASIEQLTKRPGFDKRIFQDGIYITEKDGKIIK